MSVSVNETEAVQAASGALAELTDEQLLLEYCRSEDREVFAELVLRYEQELYGYLRRFLGNQEDAEDAFQSAFLQVHLKCGQFEAGRRVKPWLYAIATNQAIDAQRRNRRHQITSLEYVRSEERESRTVADALVSREPNPAMEVDRGEVNEQLKCGLDQLSVPMRVVVYLVYYQGLKYREAAEVLSIPVGTVKSRLHTAITRLAEFWSQNCPDLD